MDTFKFEEIEYVRPDFEGMKKVWEEETEKIKKATSYAEVKDAMGRIEKAEGNMSTMMNVCSIRNTLNTTDEFYEKEIEYVQNTYPTVMESAM